MILRSRGQGYYKKSGYLSLILFGSSESLAFQVCAAPRRALTPQNSVFRATATGRAGRPGTYFLIIGDYILHLFKRN